MVVSVGPKVRTPQKQVSVRRNDHISIRCEADGDLPLNISWQVKGNRIDPTYDIRYQLKNTPMTKGLVSELTILQSSLTDRGEYACIATNAYGHDHSVIYLQVQEPPSFPTNLHVTELGSRFVSLTWSLDLPAPTSMRGVHHYAQPITNYILQFKVRMSPFVLCFMFTSTLFIHFCFLLLLDFYYKIYRLVFLNVNEKEAQDVWHDHNNQKMLPGDKTTAKITALKPSTNYHFRLYAANQLGTSAPSDILHIQTDAEVPSGPPIMVHVEAISPQELLVTWRPPERDLWNGELLGYKIGFQKTSNNGANFAKDSKHEQIYNFTRVGLSSGDGVNDFRLVSLDKYSLYSVTVQAFNSKGDGPPCEAIQARTLEDVPSAPTSCTCISLTSQNIQVRNCSPWAKKLLSSK